MKCANGLARAGMVSRGAYRCDVAVRTFGDYLASLRKARGLTQIEYAALVGVSRRSIISVERLPFFWWTDTVDTIGRFEGLSMRSLREVYRQKFWGDK